MMQQGQIRYGDGAYMLAGDAIYTMDAERPRVEAVGVIGERIVATGSRAEVAAALPQRASVFELGPRMVLPGFTDSHIHFSYISRKWKGIDLEGCRSLAEALRRIRRHVEENPDANWIDGHGWDVSRWTDGWGFGDGAASGGREAGGAQGARGGGSLAERLLTREALDRIVPDRPVALTSKDGHALWVNSAALALGGVTVNTPDPEGGRIVRDEAGEPTGLLFETALRLVRDELPASDPAAVADAMAEAQPQLYAQGITAIHCPEYDEDWRAYQRFRDSGRLGLRVTFMPQVALLDELITLGLTTGFGNEWLRLGHVKIFSDGTLGSRTAAMLAPFAGEPDNVGLATYEPQQLIELVTRAASNGLAVAIHAIGDRGVRYSLDAFAAARQAETKDAGVRLAGRPLRHRIEHAQIVHPDDFVRFGQLSVAASMQPLHCPADRDNADRYWGERARYAFAYRSLLEAGATITFGSDCPFGLDLSPDSFSVLNGIHAAVTRKFRNSDEPSWYAKQGATVHEALVAYTMAPAYVGGEEEWRGSLTPGKLADIVVLSEDLYTIKPDDIPDVAVTATIVGGRLVYGQL